MIGGLRGESSEVAEERWKGKRWRWAEAQQATRTEIKWARRPKGRMDDDGKRRVMAIEVLAHSSTESEPVGAKGKGVEVGLVQRLRVVSGNRVRGRHGRAEATGGSRSAMSRGSE